ncbi:monovalent cation/H+ antiporter complex subunit F [Thauera sp. SDU_THAU2]|uniref:monovalent cation/H+ antiporter complex subunit F n=1 Tax=Thauera sp. SDU_THAU2 TaxID=3136633 RepID=UPI00311EFFD1
MMETLLQLDQFFTAAARALLALLVIPLGMTLVRMIHGPTQADRFVALDMLTGLAVSAAALTMAATARREFLDVGMGLAVFGFMGTCALAAFLERRGRR